MFTGKKLSRSAGIAVVQLSVFCWLGPMSAKFIPPNAMMSASLGRSVVVVQSCTPL